MVTFIHVGTLEKKLLDLGPLAFFFRFMNVTFQAYRCFAFNAKMVV